ncbi:hypothetical protein YASMINEVIRUS_1560 [Yasminevirus sp. GU-2018]|uniref:C2H2-type domain-containing protein n=1 Tax=Yasminevirus sp. GU-2018 TaxID=2420051 RepID=A0A5K0UAI1_9VIRU|nr:hypothetical protein YASMINEVIRUS_1560 [Yasminevirus sp. GU-2018]
MSLYECNECQSTFKRKENLEYHLKNNVCTGKIHDTDVDDNDKKKFLCKYCNKGFTSSTNMYRHVNHACKVKKRSDEEKTQIYERLLKLEEKLEEERKKNNALEKKVVSLEKTVKKTKGAKTIINNTNSNNTNNGIVANINLIGYGKEDISKIDRKELIKILQHGFNSTIKLTEAVHFNPKHPEYHNVYITNMKDKYAMMFDGKDWTLTTKDDLISKIYDDKKNYIEENMDEFIDSLTVSRKNALDRWLATDDEDEKITQIKNEIKMLLYNKRNVVLEKRTDDKKKPVKRITSKKARKDESSDELS